MALDPKTGWEVPDPTPLARAVKFQRPPTLEEIVQRTIRGALSAHAAQLGHETFEEANDFNIDEDGSEFKSSHEFTEQDEEDLRIWKESQRVKRENAKAARGAAAALPGATAGAADGAGGQPPAPPARTAEAPPS